jgi:spermidine/putrescine transport system substrate-binding protein
MKRSIYLWFIVVVWAGFAAGCVPLAASPTPTVPPRDLVLYNWVEYMPQSVLDKFQAETGFRVVQKYYDSAEEAENNIINGNIDFDIAVIDNDVVPNLIEKGLVVQIDRHNLPNFKNISPNFRDLLFDPENQYSVPYNYGTTGLLVRTDLVTKPVTCWADLWDPQYNGKIVLREQSGELVTVALKSLGYQVNSEDPAQLEEAFTHLLELKKHASFVDVETDQAVAPLIEGKAVILVAWPGDAIFAQEQNPAIQYIIPTEGTMLWGDSLTISTKSGQKKTAESFINFILRPEIAAEIIQYYGYPNANEGARKLIDPELANDPILYPPQSVFDNGDWYLPNSPQGRALYADIWKRFLENSN